MASKNPFFVQPANPLQALMAGVQGYDRGQKSLQDAAMREAGELYAAGDVRGAQAAAARGGSLQALMGFANLQNQDRDFGFRQNEAERQGKQFQQSHGLQERQLGATVANQTALRGIQQQQLELQRQSAERPDIRIIKDVSGNEVPVLINRQGSITPLNPGGGAAAKPANPFANGKMSGEQGKVATYLDRMVTSDEVIQRHENINEGSGWWGGAIVKGPLGETPIVNTLISKERQKVMQAERNFVNAVLRRESGAVISQEEFANARQQYFPQPGDSQEVIEQKRQNRRTAMVGFAREAGPNYAPPAALTGQPQQAQQPAQPRQSQGVVDWRAYFGPQ